MPLDILYINLNSIEEGLQLTIEGRQSGTLFCPSDADVNGEAQYQMVEGFTYDYEFSDPRFHFTKSKIVHPHLRRKNFGSVSPNIYVGTLEIPVFKEGEEVSQSVTFEVRSVKATYRDDYRDMLELITENCTDLLMHANSPVVQNFEPDFANDTQTLYQRFVFVKSIIANDEFSEAIHRIVSSPVTQWKEKLEQKDIHNIRRFNNSHIKQLVTGTNRFKISDDHFLRNYGLSSLPDKIISGRKIDSVDTPENRFVKFALETFVSFCSDIITKSKPESRLYNESSQLEKKLESFLQHSMFRKISHPELLKLNSPILQRKEGYREILRVWLMFDLAAKLVWKGGDDVYKGGKKDIATLYEYWLFFRLLNLFKGIFNIEPKDISELIKETSDGLNLQLKQGRHTALCGTYITNSRRLKIRFNYNRTFSGHADYPKSGSWTTRMRPDYTLSIWPDGISETEAELEELIVHIHFDAKYKVGNLAYLLEEKSDEELVEEKKDAQQGIYKNGDLLKMHAYKDAIRRTGGAYVLYPGSKTCNRTGFHEIIPGLGAFPIHPSKTDDGINELKSFILAVIEHFSNRASQREKIAYRVFDIYRKKPLKEDEIKEPLPEPYGSNRNLIPDDTFVLVGFYMKDKLDWILRKGLYNVRAGSNRGSLRLGPKEAGAKFLLLHSHGETKTGLILRIIEAGPRIFSKKDLVKLGYPVKNKNEVLDESSGRYYLVYKIEPVAEVELINQIWDITKLNGYRSGSGSGLPFAVTLAELMRARIK
ncbi:DUF2357 domain-containing protein [Puteibacter caeruleilacunae]|nr:DUF2357 domain-containing protein [Puteibacter caeruleilacunae]